MSYQVLARKWRPQRFEDVIGQRAVTQTLRNAITSRRIAQAFVFAGPRGVGKTTTARILARALNCIEGPTADPCGRCDACVEIAEGRDIDVLEIDAATHTGIDNVREVIIAGLSILPVRNRYKIFVIDEVHQLSAASFNALLKSIEEPPPHAVFVMATTELHKVPDTILSRSQVFEFRTISGRAIAAQLRTIADAEGVSVQDDALALIARAADGSMRDAETAFDQVIAFAGERVSLDNVATVLGLVGRDLLFDVLTAVADEDATAAFDLAGRAVESGYDLKLVCRELSRIVRDLMVVAIDPARLEDPEIASEGERERLRAMAVRFSREDLLRAFDVVTRAEAEIRVAAEPRHHLEMALLRWMHLRKLVPIERLIEQLQGGALSGGGTPGPAGARSAPAPAARTPVAGPQAQAAPSKPPEPVRATKPHEDPERPAGNPSGMDHMRNALAQQEEERRAQAARPAPPVPAPPKPVSARPAAGLTKETFLREIQDGKAVFARTVVAQAQRIDVETDRVVFVFAPVHSAFRANVEQNKTWLETIAERLAGRRIPVTAITVEPAASPSGSDGGGRASGHKNDLMARALDDPTVQAMLSIFPAEIRDVEELK
jgi:DNA polymerase-3 subunit gamma/tau